MKNIVFTLTFIYLICQICSNSHSNHTNSTQQSDNRVEYIKNNNFDLYEDDFAYISLNPHLTIVSKIPGGWNSTHAYLISSDSYYDKFNYFNFFNHNLTLSQQFEAEKNSNNCELRFMILKTMPLKGKTLFYVDVNGQKYFTIKNGWANNEEEEVIIKNVEVKKGDNILQFHYTTFGLTRIMLSKVSLKCLLTTPKTTKTNCDVFLSK